MNAINRSDTMQVISRGLVAGVLTMLFVAFPASAQDSSIFTQCPADTTLHPDTDADPMTREDGIKCKHLSGGDGMVTMADGQSLYIFSFADIPMPEDSGVSLAEYPGWVMDQGMMAANAPAPTIVVEEDDELFLSLTNVGMALRPDLFDPHTVHWHGFPQASSVFDGVPDASISVNMGATLTYYYNAKDAGTYMYHCHVEATEHMQMGMLGNLYVLPRQNRCDTIVDDPNVPGSTCPAGHVNGTTKYAYNDGDGTTAYNVDYPIQIGSFDKAFHDASETVQPLPFAGMRDTYFLLNGRGYPDTVKAATGDPSMITDGRESQPVSSLITAAPNQKVLLRISNLNVTQFNTIGTNGPAMEVIALDARLLRDDDGNNLYYKTNSLTLGGGQSADVLIDTSGLSPGQTFLLYSTNLDMLANDAQNFGGMMTEIRIN